MVYGSDTHGYVFALSMQTGLQVWKTHIADEIGQDNGFLAPVLLCEIKIFPVMTRKDTRT